MYPSLHIADKEIKAIRIHFRLRSKKLGRLFSVGETKFLSYAVYSAERGTTGRQKVSGHSYDAS